METIVVMHVLPSMSEYVCTYTQMIDKKYSAQKFCSSKAVIHFKPGLFLLLLYHTMHRGFEI